MSESESLSDKANQDDLIIRLTYEGKNKFWDNSPKSIKQLKSETVDIFGIKRVHANNFWIYCYPYFKGYIILVIFKIHKH